MAVRPYWKGYLKLSLVTCAVTLSPATTEGERVKFHTLNRKTGDRIYTRYGNSATGKTVDDEHQVKAYEEAEDHYVVLEDEVTIGTGAAIIQGVTVGAGSMIGAGAGVVRNVPPGVTAVGTPAKSIGPRL